MKNKYIPIICIITGASMWGFIGLFVNRLSAYGAADMLAIRSLFSALGLFVFIGIKSPWLLRIRIRDIWIFTGTGIISFAAYNIFYTLAIRYTSMATAAVLLYTSPIFVTIMAALLFGERLSLKKCVAVVLAFSGCVMISGFSGSSAFGLIMGLMSGFSYALYSIFGRFALRKYSAMTVTAYTFLFAFLASAAFADWNGIVSHLNTESAFWWFMYAMLSGLIPYMLYTYGLAYVEASKAAVMACIEPVVAALCGTLIMNEPIGIVTVCGICLILYAVILLRK